jgi:hypothetical protein
MSARADLCGGRSAMVVPTATSLPAGRIAPDQYPGSVRVLHPNALPHNPSGGDKLLN